MERTADRRTVHIWGRALAVCNNVALRRGTIKAERVSGWQTYLLGMAMLIGAASYHAWLAVRRHRESQVWQFRASLAVLTLFFAIWWTRQWWHG